VDARSTPKSSAQHGSEARVHGRKPVSTRVWSEWVSWDGSIAVWMATHRVGFLDQPSVWLGTSEKLGALWVVLAVLVGSWRRAGVRRTLALAITTAIATFAADSISFLLKDATHRGRPFEVYRRIHPLYVVHSSSFPAGHAATAFAGAVLLSAAVRRYPIVALLILLATLVGWSRVYDGVHYPSDVVAGAAVGAVCGAAIIWVLRRPRFSSLGIL
jgi:membrane-associated phospholipid phosphatase